MPETVNKSISRRLPSHRTETSKADLAEAILSVENEPNGNFPYGSKRSILPFGNQKKSSVSTKKLSLFLTLICQLLFILRLFYTEEKMTFHFCLWRRNYSEMINFAALLFYFADALCTLHVFLTHRDDQAFMLTRLIGLSGLTKSKFPLRKANLLNLTLVLIVALSYGIYALLEDIPFDYWSFTNMILGRASQLHPNYLTARVIPFDQHEMYRSSVTIPNFLLGFIWVGVCSKFISCVIQAVKFCVKAFPITNDLKEDLPEDVEEVNGIGCNNIYGSNKLAKAVEEVLREVKEWTINYYLIIWGYNYLMSQFDYDLKNSGWVHVILFVLSLWLTYYLWKISKSKAKVTSHV